MQQQQHDEPLVLDIVAKVNTTSQAVSAAGAAVGGGSGIGILLISRLNVQMEGISIPQPRFEQWLAQFKDASSCGLEMSHDELMLRRLRIVLAIEQRRPVDVHTILNPVSM